MVAGATLVATVDRTSAEVPGGWVSVRDGLIEAVGPPGHEPPARQRIDASGCLVTPGLVNTHQHMWQNLTRSFAPMTTTGFLGWLGVLYPIWAQIGAEDVYLATRVAMAELAASGCTTTADHLYLQRPAPRACSTPRWSLRVRRASGCTRPAGRSTGDGATAARCPTTCSRTSTTCSPTAPVRSHAITTGGLARACASHWGRTRCSARRTG